MKDINPINLAMFKNLFLKVMKNKKLLYTA